MMDPEIPKNEGFFEPDRAHRARGLRAQPATRASRCQRGHAPSRRRGRRGHRGRDAARAARQGRAADLQDRHPDDHRRRRPAHRPAVHRPLGRGLRRLVQRGEGHGRLGRARRVASATSGRPPPRSTRASTRTCSGAATTAPTPAARASGAACAAATTRRKCCVDAKVYTYVVGMKYPMPGHLRRRARARRTSMVIRYGSDDPFVVQHTADWVPIAAPASASCTTTAAAAAGATRSTVTRRPCSTTCSTSTCRVEGAERDYGVVLTGSLEDLTLAIDEAATDALRAERAAAARRDAGTGSASTSAGRSPTSSASRPTARSCSTRRRPRPTTSRSA